MGNRSVVDGLHDLHHDNPRRFSQKSAPTFDIFIVSKDRYPLLFSQVKRVKNNFPYNKIIIVDSTEVIPSIAQDFYHDEGVEYYHTPNVKLGLARQTGLKAVSTPFFFMIDDDITFRKGTAEKLYSAIMKYGSEVFAISPVILFGTNKDILSVYKRKTKDTEGVSSGFCIMHRSTTDKIGGFNTQVHIGEDAELFYRAKRHGYRWIRKHDVFVEHPGTNVDFIFRTWRHREGIMTSVAYGFDSYHGLIIKRIRDIFLNVLSFMKYRNFRTMMFLVSSDFISILAYLRGIVGGESYALHKKKIV